jgi:Flagellar hook capping protein
MGINIFKGNGKDDYFDGGGGLDRAVFSGDYDEYAILIGAAWNDSITSIVDFYAERDGVDTLEQVEEFEFNGAVYTMQDLLSTHDDGVLPTEFRMFPNYPNPFNPKTKIKFELPKSEYVRLVIMDLLGRNIKTLAEGEIRAGYHDVEWDGTMDSGSPVPSGVYLIVFDSKNYKKSYKALLIK